LRLFTAAILVFFTITLLSCAQDIERSEVIGAYRANFDTEIEIIVLRDDNTFCQYYKFDNEDLDSNCGLWSFTPNKGISEEAKIQFSGYLWHIKTSKMKIVRHGSYLMKTHVNKIRILFGEELDVYYELITQLDLPLEIK
jgi:hypothetical protein